MRVGPARRAAWIAAFAALYAILVVLGLMLRENSQQLVIIWPAAGLLFMALWFSPRRSWIWILGVQVAVEFSINLVRFTHFPWLHLQYTLANSLDAVVGALIARRLIATPQIPRIKHVCNSWPRLRSAPRQARWSAPMICPNPSALRTTCTIGSSGGRGIGWGPCAWRRC